jgi:thiamine-monophosphate kinase
VVTTDTQREGIHFRFDWQTPEEIGQKAVSVTLSDLAASYAEPAALFINLCLPKTMSEETILRVYHGIHRGLHKNRCALGGGNTSGGESFSLDLFAIGQGREDIFPTRSAAKPGFGLFVTGPLGLARAGLEALRKKDPDFPGLIQRFKAPVARFDAAVILASHGVRCVMDISDGLSGDARHIAKASGISIEIELKKSAITRELDTFCRKHGRQPLDMAVAGGEDYELLFACPFETFSRITKMLPEAFQVGRCLDFQGQHLVGNAANISSFQHG